MYNLLELIQLGLIFSLFLALIFIVRKLNAFVNNEHVIEKNMGQQLTDMSFSLEKAQLKHQFLLEKNFQDFKQVIESQQSQLRELTGQQHLTALTTIQEGLQKTTTSIQKQLLDNATHHSSALNERMIHLTQEIQEKLNAMNQQVDRRLNQGFDRTNETFARIAERIAVIDAAQQKITELSTNVVSLQELLSDKRSRGAFGEVQLSSLIHNVLSEQNFSMQHTLSNGKRVDCLLFLPQPTGNLAIDAKFPLENYQLMLDQSLDASQRKLAMQRFRQDLRKHIQDIAEKYIISGETADGAVMFLPAEAVFAEIHAHYPDIVELSHKQRVWLASPTTMMAIITTARSVLKDAATRKQVHIIQDHLRALATDFGRFEKRMDSLSKHISQAHNDVNEVQTSAKKIASRFSKIERVELSHDSVGLLEE